MITRSIAPLRQLGPVVSRYFLSIALVSFAVDGGVVAVLLNLYLARLSYGPEQIGLVNSAGSLVFALVSLPAGMLGQRFGSRRMLVIGLGILAGGCLLLPLADLLPATQRLGWLIGQIIVVYTGLAIYFVNTAPFLLSVIEAARRNALFSLQTGLSSFAAFVGSLLGGLLPPLCAAIFGLSADDPAAYRYALLLAAVALLPGIVALRALPDARSGHASEAQRPPARGTAPSALRALVGLLALIALVRTLQVSGLAVVSSFFNVYLDAALRLPSAQIGAIIAAGRLLGVPAALATGRLTARFGNRAVVIGATLGTAVSILPLALIPHWGAAGFGFIGVIGFSWVRYAASLVYFLELVPPQHRATVSGVTEMAAGVCFTLLTFSGGYIIALLGFQTLFLLGAAITALSAGVFWLLFRSRP